MATGQVIFDGRVHVDYGQVLVVSDDEDLVDHGEAFHGQRIALLGAGVPGALVLTTGTHTGDVGLRVVLHETEPDVGPEWEDVVEATFVPERPDVAVHGLMSAPVCTVDLPRRSYRVRWSGRGRDAAYDGVVLADQPLVDEYELALWPDRPRPEAVVRDRSRRGGDEHRAQRRASRGATGGRGAWAGREPQPPQIPVEDPDDVLQPGGPDVVHVVLGDDDGAGRATP